MVQWKERGALLSQDLIIGSETDTVTGTGFYFTLLLQKYSFDMRSDSREHRARY